MAKNKAGKPICGASIQFGPKVGRNVVYAWRNCQRVVKNEGDRCWQHPLGRTRIR